VSASAANDHLRGVAEEAYRGVRTCVTGGAGFIGSHLCAALARRGARLVVLDDLSTGSEENLRPARAVASELRFVRGSILDPAALADATGGCAVVFHLAASASVPRSIEDPASSFEVNATGTLRVLEAARATKGDLPRFVYSASSSAYGDRPGQPRVESMAPDPRSPYAAGKLAGEHLVSAFAHGFGLEAVSLRYFNIFGPRQRADSPYAAVIPRFVDAIVRGVRPLVYGDGAQTRDFTHVSNAVAANLLAGAGERHLHGEVVNVGAGRSTSVLDLLGAIGRLLGVRPDPEFAPARAGDVMHSTADLGAARALLGYRVIVGLEDGLRETVEALRSAR
jgi:UDP-glucose 4-epimerase